MEKFLIEKGKSPINHTQGATTVTVLAAAESLGAH